LSTDFPDPATAFLRSPLVTSGSETDGARVVRFDRPLVDQPAWADPRMGRQLAEASRAAREQGLAAGYATGWAQGRRDAAAAERADAAARAEREEAARRQQAARAQTLLASLAQAGRTLSEHAAPAWDELVEVLIDGAMGILAAGLGRELSAVDAETLEAARAALRLLPGDDAVTLHVNPGDVPLLGNGEVDGLPDGLTVVADAGVAAGTVVARTPLQSLPVDLRAALRTAEEVLRG
jgi:flagellar assembly protein FliH